MKLVKNQYAMPEAEILVLNVREDILSGSDEPVPGEDDPA